MSDLRKSLLEVLKEHQITEYQVLQYLLEIGKIKLSDYVAYHQGETTLSAIVVSLRPLEP